MSTIYTLNGKVLKIGNKIVTVSDSPVPPVDYVIIGTQAWKKQNLAIDDGQGGIYTQTVNYGQGTVLEYYYTWDAAVRVADSVEGWHLPSILEFRALADAVGGTSIAGTKLKSSYGWSDDGNGTDDYDFSALPAGYYSQDIGNFYNLGSNAYFWTSKEGTSSWSALSRGFNTGATMISGEYPKTIYAFSVRLIRDSE